MTSMGHQERKCLRIMPLGDIGVGKSSLIHRIIYESFPLPEYVPAIPADFFVKHVEVDNQQVALQLWDSNGAERFRPMHKFYYRNVHCFMLMFSTRDAGSFESLQSWFDEYSSFCSDTNSEKAAFILLGNKLDLDGEKECQVSGEKIARFCELNGNMPYLEISVKDGTNLNEALEKVANHALQKKEILDSAEKHRHSVNVAPRNTHKGCF